MLGEENSIIAARVLRIEELNGVAVPSQLGERVETTDTDASARSIVAIRPPADLGDIGRRGGIRASHSRVTPLLLSNAPIGRAQARRPVTNAHLVCSPLLETTNN